MTAFTIREHIRPDSSVELTGLARRGDELALVIDGADRGRLTDLAVVVVLRRYGRALEPEVATLLADAPRLALRDGRALCAHARGGLPIEAAPGPANAPTTLAIGPEGGWIEREVDTFAARGFTIVSLGDAILRTEAAVAGALAQLALLRRLHR